MPPTIKNFLLTGRPGIGKTTVAEAIIRELGGDDTGGIVTGEILERGTRKGFRIVTVDGETAPWMHWGQEHSIGQYLDLLKAILGITLSPLGYL